MSVRFTADHITTQTGDEVKIEIFDANFTGTAGKLKGAGESFGRIVYQQLNPRNPTTTPIQSGELTASVYIETSAHRTLLDDILNANERRFRLRYYLNGTRQWEGFILPDLSSYAEDRQPFVATFVAKDFTALKGVNYTLDSGRELLIDVIADILSDLGTNGDIVTDTSFSNALISVDDDYLNQIYIDKSALRIFARTGDEVDEEISKYDALNRILSNNKLTLIQSEGEFYIRQWSAYSDAENTLRARYLADGSQVNKDVQDVTYSPARIVLGSTNNGNAGIKESRIRFDHRTTVQGIQFPSTFQLEDDPLVRSFTQFFNTDGNQQLRLVGNTRARYDDTIIASDVLIEIRALSRFWNTTTNAWQVDQIANRFEMTDTELSGGKIFFERPINILTSNVPQTAGNQIEIRVFSARDDSTSTIADFTQFIDFRFEVVNPTVQDGNNTAIDYLLRQGGDFSVLNENTIPNWFGDGPTSFALSAYTTNQSGTTLTASDWRRRGESIQIDFHNLYLREDIDVQRTWTRRISATVKSVLQPHNILSYDSEQFGFSGGEFDFYSGVWQAELFRVNIQTDVNDTFQIIYRTTADGATGSATPGGGSGGGGNGLSITVADGRYFRQSNNLSEGNPAIIRDNIDVFSKGEVLDITDLLASAVNANRFGLLSLFDIKADKTTRITLETTQGLEGGSTIDLDGDATLSVNIADSGVTTAKIADGAVTTGKINDGAVTNPKLATDSVSTDKIIDGNVTNAKLQNSTISGKALGTDLDALSAGDGLTGVDYNGSTARTFSADVVAPIAIQSQKIGLTQNEPLYLNGSALDVRNHGDGVRGVLLPSDQDIFGAKTFKAGVTIEDDLESEDFTVSVDGLIDGIGYDYDEQRLSVASLRANALIVKSFTAEVAQIFRGELAISKSFGIVAREFTVPAVSSTGTLVMHDVEGFGGFNVFENGDIVELKLFYYEGGGGQLVIGSVFGTVTMATPNTPETGLQSYTFTTNFLQDPLLAGEVVQAGAEARSFGSVASPVGVIFDSVFNGAPTRDTYTWATNPWQAVNRTLRTRTGDLDGIPNASGYGFWSSRAFLTESVLVGDLTKSGNYLEFDGTDLTVYANEIFLGAGQESIGQSFLSLQSTLVQLGLQTQSSFGTISFLAGQTIIKQESTDGEGNTRLALIDLDTRPTVGSRITLSADDIRLLGGQSVSAFAGDISGDVSALELRSDRFDLYTSSQSIIGEILTPSTGTFTSIEVLPDRDSFIPSGTRLFIADLTLITTASVTLEASVPENIPVQSTTVSGSVTGNVLASVNVASISGTVSEQGSAITANANAINLVASDLSDAESDIGALELRANRFDLYTLGNGRVGELFTPIMAGTVTSIDVDATTTVFLQAGTRLFIADQVFTVSTAIQLTSGAVATISVNSVTSPAISTGDVIASVNSATISGRVDDLGSELVLKAQSDGTLSFVALAADPDTGSSVLIKSDKFDLVSNGLEINNTTGIRLDISDTIDPTDLRQIVWADNGNTYLGLLGAEDTIGNVEYGGMYSDFALYFASGKGDSLSAGFKTFIGGGAQPTLDMVTYDVGPDLQGEVRFNPPDPARALYIRFTDIPTSPFELPSGTVWNDSGTLRIT